MGLKWVCERSFRRRLLHDHASRGHSKKKREPTSSHFRRATACSNADGRRPETPPSRRTARRETGSSHGGTGASISAAAPCSTTADSLTSPQVAAIAEQPVTARSGTTRDQYARTVQGMLSWPSRGIRSRLPVQPGNANWRTWGDHLLL